MITRRDVLKLLGVTAALPAVKSVEQLKLEPDDCIVITYDELLSDANVKVIRQSFEACGERFKNVPIIILDKGMDIKVLRKNA